MSTAVDGPLAAPAGPDRPGDPGRADGPVFEARGVDVEVGAGAATRRILRDVAFDVRDRELVSIMGRSGTGKTTLLKVLGGLRDAAPHSVVRASGVPVDGPPEGVIFLFQDYAASLLPWRTIERNVSLGLEGRLERPQVEQRVTEALDMVGLADRRRDYPWELSGGMQQRVQLARSLAMRASVLLMDEPFGSLDAMTKATLQDELLQVHRDLGATIVFVTHDIDEAIYLSDRILILEGGPATIARSIPVDLPRPRDQLATKELPEFLALRRTVYEAIVGDA
ncbi:MAG: ABC transporter ATP-binding protein [Solirubrobacteraceae bacterium]|nr:ABC transporter ATP-binding protein [Solirubrobacteraceae bacterium]